MIFPSYLSVGAFALAANAFLIPGDTEAAVEAFEHPDLVKAQQESQLVKVDCSTCPYALNSHRNGRHEWTMDVASDIVLRLESDGNYIKFNGEPFYPITAPGLPPTLQVHQVKKDNQPKLEGFVNDLKLSYSLEYSEKAFRDSDKLVTILMTILGLDGEMVKIDDVEIKAIKSGDGKLTLHSAAAVPSDPNAPEAKCGNVLCRVFTKLITGMQKAKASAKTAGHKVKCFCIKCLKHLPGHTGFMRPHHHHKGPGGAPSRRPDGMQEFADQIELPQGGNHSGHRHGGFLRHFSHIMKNTVKIAFVPILIGIAFGMAASAIGMLVGQIVVFVWMRYRRNDQVTYEPLQSDEKDCPPAYQDVPNVEALDEKEVEAKA